MSLSLPHRPANDPLISHHGAGPQNTNLGSGNQTNNTISGGNNNQQYIGPVTIQQPPPTETPPLPSIIVPFLRDDGFVARPEFAELQDKLSKGSTRVALTGLGGIGKSQFAIESCYRARDNSPNTWVLWIHASNAARFDQDVRKLADDVKIPGRKEKDADTFQLVRGWLNDGRRIWLIVLDNADNADFLFEAPQISGSDASTRPRIESFPVCLHGSILVTTRRRAVAVRLADDRNIIDLQPDQDHAIELLRSKLRPPTQALRVRELAVALESMPLAVAQAAAYINKKTPRCSIEDYLLKLKKSDKSKLSLLKMQSDELRRDRLEAKNSILLTWQISFEHIYSTRRSAADLLSLMSLFDHQGIPEKLVRLDMTDEQNDSQSNKKDDESDGSSEGSAEDAFEIDIDTLRDYSFISVTPEGATFEMHRLVQLAAQMWLKEKKEYQLWETRSLQRLDTVLPRPEYVQWKDCRTLYPQTALVLNSNTKERDALLSLASILHKAAWFAVEQGWYTEAEVMARRSVDVRNDILGKQHPSTLTSMGNLASTYRSQGRWKEAEEIEVEVMEIMRIVLGLEHPSTLISMGNLASTYKGQGRWKEAEEIEVEVRETMTTVLGLEHPYTLISMSNLASTYWRQGRWKEAEELEVEVRETRRIVLGPEHPDTLASMANLASIYHTQGRWKEAEELHVEVIKIERTVLGPEHPDTLTSMGNLTMIYWKQGRWKEAKDLMAVCVEGRTRVLGATHPKTVVSVSWFEAMCSRIELDDCQGDSISREHAAKDKSSWPFAQRRRGRLPSI